ncbi:MAG: cyclic pyranopterin monophosphate synthase MoaC [Pseudomonadota bacterium]
MQNQFTHIDHDGNARMVNISDKTQSKRKAIARAFIHMREPTLKAIDQKKHNKKGDVLAIAQIAGIMAAKQTGQLIPLCHPLGLENVELKFKIDPKRCGIYVESTCINEGKTGVEMEAMTAVSVACLTIYDMCKALDRSMRIEDIELIHKSGGKSGQYDKTPHKPNHKSSND